VVLEERYMPLSFTTIIDDCIIAYCISCGIMPSSPFSPSLSLSLSLSRLICRLISPPQPHPFTARNALAFNAGTASITDNLPLSAPYRPLSPAQFPHSKYSIVNSSTSTCTRALVPCPRPQAATVESQRAGLVFRAGGTYSSTTTVHYLPVVLQAPHLLLSCSTLSAQQVQSCIQ
jgi:hypothetical protein